MKFLLKKDKGYYVKKFMELSPESLKAVASNERFKILKELKIKPEYPNELAKKLKIHEQKIYYHINELKNAGVIKIVKTEEIKGSTANYYGLTADAYGLEIPGEYETLSLKEKTPEDLKNFFKEFNNNGKFNGLIIVGDPMPHGPYKAIARDGHYSSQIGILIGSIFGLSNEFNIKLDTDAINEKLLTENMIIIGGPGTNLVSARLNEHLSTHFNEQNYWTSIKSKIKEYTDETCGLIIKTKNPFNKEKTIILLAGLRVAGTKACIIAITKQHEELLKNYSEGELIKIIKGYDYDGDGKIDGVEILE